MSTSPPGLKCLQRAPQIGEHNHAGLWRQALRAASADPRLRLRRQQLPQLADLGCNLSCREGCGERYGNDLGPVCHGGHLDVEKWRLRAERNTGRTIKYQQGLDHQQTQEVLLLGDGGQQDAWTDDTRWQAADRLAQQGFHLLRVQVFLENLELATHPRFANRLIEWRNNVDDESLQTKPHHRLVKGLTQYRQIVGLDQPDGVSHDRVATPRLGDALRRARIAERRELVLARRKQPARAVTMINQAFHQSQSVDLLGRIDPLAVVVAGWLRETVTAFPNAQGVFAESGVALDGADIQSWTSIHIVLDKLPKTVDKVEVVRI